MEGRLMNVRKLVALDIALHGPRFIMVEFGVGTPVILLVGGLLVVAGEQYLGWYLLLTGLNYLPLLAYALLVVRKGSAKVEVDEDLARDRHYVRKYSIQQFFLFVPLFVLLLALVQMVSHRGEGDRTATMVSAG